MNKKYKEYLNSSDWNNLKLDLFNKRGYKCEKCNKTRKLHVHQITYDNIFNEEPEDLIILCEKCHAKEHGIYNNKKGKKIKILTLSQKLQLKKKNKKAYKKYRRNLLD